MQTTPRRIILLLALITTTTNAAADVEISSESPLTKIAFGSCHKRKYVRLNDTTTIWDAIRQENPQTFLWTGDAVYPPSRGTASLQQLDGEYQQMLTNQTLGYATLQPPLGIYGTWDDHDYGANDGGKELVEKQGRRQLFLDFLNYSQELQSKISKRRGLYHSIDFVSSGGKEEQQQQQQQQQQRVKVIVLDTRWNRDRHCIPSVAANIPLGAAISCLTRWFLAGMGGGGGGVFCSNKTTILGDDQWAWLSNELETTTAQVHIIISSIQVLSTNPAMEGWGHFPHEQERLLQLLNSKQPSGLVLLSGDVHHGEIIDPASHTKKHSFLEVTSSGLTHSCTMPFYGKLCEPLLKQFSSHRRHSFDYYLDRNFGTLVIDWKKKQLQVAVQSDVGKTVLTTGWRSFHWDQLSQSELKDVARTVDGHLLPKLKWILLAFFVVAAVLTQMFIWMAYAEKPASATTRLMAKNRAGEKKKED